MFWPVRRTFVLAAVLLAATALSACGGGASWPSTPSPASNGDLANPPEVASQAGAVNLTLTAVVNPATGGPAIRYNGALVPPTIRVWPGDTLNITYINDLPAENTEPFNATNLHFHGLSTSPNPPADDSIDILAMPGQTLHYIVPIPKTQPPGLYWYHSHSHGESNWQLYNGMSGAIVVNGTASYAPETAGLPERVIVLRNLLANPQYSELSLARRAARTARRHASEADAPSTICTQPWGITGEYTTINGVSAGPPRIAILSGQKQFWRVVNASADGYYNVSVDGRTIQLVSVDGVPMKAYPGASEQSVGNVVIPPAGRAEFIVTGTTGTSFFRTACTDTGPDGDPNPSQILASIANGRATTLPTVPVAGTPPPIGTYEEAISAPAQQRTLLFSENADGSAFYLNGRQYDPTGAPMFTARSGTVEQWTLENQSGELHAFHIHQVHFIVQDIDGVAQPPYWRDTVTLPYQHADGTPSVSHVLIDFRDPAIRGTFLFHCHLLEHEDGGMMAKIAVQ